MPVIASEGRGFNDRQGEISMQHLKLWQIRHHNHQTYHEAE